MSVLPKIDLQIQSNPKIIAEIFVDVNKLLLKFIWKGIETSTAKNKFVKKNKVGELSTT